MTHLQRSKLRIAFVYLDHALTHQLDDTAAFDLLWGLHRKVKRELYEAVRDNPAHFETLLESLVWEARSTTGNKEHERLYYLA